MLSQLARQLKVAPPRDHCRYREAACQDAARGHDVFLRKEDNGEKVVLKA
jgi:hypothetical protein